MSEPKLDALRTLMKQHGLFAYLITSSDSHDSEYPAAYFEARKYFSGFTGSAGSLVVLPDRAALFTDSRYFVQASQELAGSQIELFRIGEPGVPTLLEYLTREVSGTLGFDGRTVLAAFCESLRACGIALNSDLDLAEELWSERPALPCRPVYRLVEQYAGTKSTDKLALLREELKRCGARTYLIAALDEIAWLLNLRGSDVSYNPVFLAYFALEADRALLFTDLRRFSPEIWDYLASLGVEVRPYEKVFEYAGAAPGPMLLSKKRISERLWQAIRVEKLDDEGFCALQKSVKSQNEIQNLRLAHEKDGAALCRLIFYIKTHIGKESLRESDVARLADTLRAEQEHCLGPSFETIAGFGPNAAIVHYCAKPGADALLEPRGLLLLDSGAHYLEGTTDATRAVALGALTDEEKLHYTLVLKGMLAVMEAKFSPGSDPSMLDIAARTPLEEYGLGYGHGTGHGVGYLLCVHEGPVAIRDAAAGAPPLEPGMVVSDEPGVYIEGSHGVRIENQLLCCKKPEGRYGFEALTLVPFERSAIDFSLLTPAEIAAIDIYHARVRRLLLPRLDQAEGEWLRRETRPLLFGNEEE